jgi:hypothetical protein
MLVVHVVISGAIGFKCGFKLPLHFVHLGHPGRKSLQSIGTVFGWKSYSYLTTQLRIIVPGESRCLLANEVLEGGALMHGDVSLQRRKLLWPYN